jgi:hypothetical protein
MSDQGVRTFGNIDPKKKRRQTFTLQGLYEFDVEGPDGEVLHKEDDVWEETFTCLSKVPAKVLDKLVASMGMSRGEVSFDNLHICGFLRACLVPQDRDRWDTLLDDEARIVDLDEDLSPILDLLTNGLFGRPTKPPSR